MSDNLERRELFMRATVTEDGQLVRGVGVPYGETITVWGQRERLEAGAVDAAGALLFYRHTEPIGVVVNATDDKTGWHPTGRFSNTRAAQDARELARDGALPGLSIGFEPLKWRYETDDEGDVIVYEKVRVREVSLVPFPAYPSATVTEVREDTNHKKEEPMGAQTEERESLDIRELREEFTDMKRQLAVIADNTHRQEETVTDTRSAGEILKAIVGGDEETIRAYNELLERDYTGGVLADAIDKPGWVGDHTRLFDASSGVLADTFSTGTLPKTGSSIEYAELDANTLDVDEQLLEGDDIAMGQLSIKTSTAPVKTYAGGTELSRQQIERATVGVLNTSMLGLTIAAAARKKAVLRAAYAATVTAREAIAANAGVVVLGATLSAGVAGNWEDALIDAAIKYEALNLSLDKMIVSATVFKKLRSLTVSGERVFTVAKDNASGTLDLPGLGGDFAGIPVRLDTGASGDKAAFVNRLAIRAYDSPLVTLSDEKISNLTKQFAVYRYGAVAAEIPAAIIPIKLAAS